MSKSLLLTNILLFILHMTIWFVIGWIGESIESKTTAMWLCMMMAFIWGVSYLGLILKYTIEEAKEEEMK